MPYHSANKIQQIILIFISSIFLSSALAAETKTEFQITFGHWQKDSVTFLGPAEGVGWTAEGKQHIRKVPQKLYESWLGKIRHIIDQGKGMPVPSELCTHSVTVRDLSRRTTNGFICLDSPSHLDNDLGALLSQIRHEMAIR